MLMWLRRVGTPLPTALDDFVLELLVDCFELTATALDDESFELFVPVVIVVDCDCFELPDLLSWLFFSME